VTTVTAFPYDCMVLIESPDPSNGSMHTIGSGVAKDPTSGSVGGNSYMYVHDKGVGKYG
jgi:hypothetical protein